MSSSYVPTYNLFSANIADKLKDREWFIACMAHNFSFIADEWNCITIVNKKRMGEAYDYWIEDLDRTLDKGIDRETVSLDHFKEASFLVFWLRRMIPIDTYLKQNLGDRYAGKMSDDQKYFLQYGNEICAFQIGFRICLYFEISRPYEQENVTAIRHFPDIDTHLKNSRLKTRMLKDFVMIMKHKNMSPHSLFLLYKSLFTNISLTPPAGS